jgi:hypothetical protein
MKRIAAAAAAAGFALVLSAGSALAYDLDPATGIGFVGKGEVQLAFGWNNKALQDNANLVSFDVSSVTTESSTWTCDRDAGPQTQERSNTTTTTTKGVLESVTRDKKQVTGFLLEGFDGTESVDTESDGPAVGSCPTGWTAIDLVTGEPEVGESSLYVSFDGGEGVLLPAPVVEPTP